VADEKRAWTLTATAVFALSATIALEVVVGYPRISGAQTPSHSSADGQPALRRRVQNLEKTGGIF